jgi:hypothetical protein
MAVVAAFGSHLIDSVSVENVVKEFQQFPEFSDPFSLNERESFERKIQIYYINSYLNKYTIQFH